MRTLLLLTVILFAIPPPSDADIIRTLVATGGSIGERQDVPFGNITGADFGIGGIFHSFGAALPSFNFRPTAGQVFDQSGTLQLNAFLGIDGHACCDVGGGFAITAVPALLVPMSGGHSQITSAFTATGGLIGNTFCPYSGCIGPYGQYAFQGHGVMTTDFFPCTVESGVCGWDRSELTFLPGVSETITGGTISGDTAGPVVPEPATWLLLASGLTWLIIRRTHEQICSV